MKTETFDIVVVGGGPAGVAAAVAAARNGAKTLLIEQYGCLGGTPVNSLIPVFCPFSDQQRPIVEGIGLEILNKMRARSWVNPEPEKDNGIPSLDWVPIDPEILKRVLDDIVDSSSAGLLLHTDMIGAQRSGDVLQSIQIHSESGIQSISAKIFIDCTGNAAMIALAGAGFEYGGENGKVQGMTLCFRLAGVDGRRFLRYKQQEGEDGNLHVAVKRAKERGDFVDGESSVSTFVLQNWDMAGVNFGHVFGKDPLDADQLTQAELEARRKLPELVRFFQTYVPGMETCYVAASGPAIGVRESRRIEGEYRLTREDYFRRCQFPDAIARYAYPIDVHEDTSQLKPDAPAKSEFKSTAYQAGESYTIPYRALLPRDLQNVIVAGRSLSSDRAANGSARVAPACFAMGQAAGTAAAMAIELGVGPKAIPVSKLQERLRAQGVHL